VFCVGLTGGIASGKTTVAALFAELGAGLVDTDEVAREVVAVGEPGLEAVVAAFGTAILLDAGDLDRGSLREIVFHDADARRKLEAILHPLIRARTRTQLDALQAPYAMVVVPLLIETNFSDIVDRVLVVDCPRDLQLRRLIQRDQISAEDAEAMVAAQVDRETRRARADDIIDSSQSLATIGDRSTALHADYLRRAAGHDDGN
jgi:dephospho-CoA kinase